MKIITLLFLLCQFSLFAQKQVTNQDRTFIGKCFNIDNNQTVILATTNSDYVPSESSRHGTVNTDYINLVYVIDSNLNVVKQYNFNELLTQYTNFAISSAFLKDSIIVFTGNGTKIENRLRFTGTLNLITDIIEVTDEYIYSIEETFNFNSNPFDINDSLIGVIDYLFPSRKTYLHLINDKGLVSSKSYDVFTFSPLPFYSQLNTNSNVYLKDANFEINIFDIDSLIFTQTSSRQYLASLPTGMAVQYDSLFYMFGPWLGVNDDGFYEQGWTPSRAYDLFLYVYDQNFKLVSRTEFTDKAWYQQNFTEPFTTQNYLLEDTLLKVVYTSFLDETATGSKEHLTGEKFEDSKLTFATVDLQGNLIDKKEYFENDGKNHFNWNLIPNKRGYLLVNTVLDVNEFPDTTTNLELMQLDKQGVVLGVKTIFNTSISRLNLYPNPAQSQGQVNLSWSGMQTQSWQVKLYDNQGRLVHETSLQQGLSESILQLPELPSGTYIVRAEGSGKQVHTGTVVVE